MYARFSREDRTLIRFAAQEAADLGHSRLGTDHLILGMLCNARTPIFGLLGEHGLALPTVREAVRTYHHDHPDAADTEAVVDDAQRYEQDREALSSIGIDLDKLRESVRGTFGDDIAEGWGERGRGRDRRRHGRHDGERRGRGRGPRDGFGGEGPWEPGRGRRGPRGGGHRTRPRFTADARAALAYADDIARENGDLALRPEHLMLGILRVGDAASGAVLAGVDADAISTALRATLQASPAI